MDALSHRRAPALHELVAQVEVRGDRGVVVVLEPVVVGGRGRDRRRDAGEIDPARALLGERVGETSPWRFGIT